MPWYKRLLIKLLRTFYISCEEATFLMTKKKHEALSGREAIDLKIHMIGCRFCKVYEKQWEFLMVGLGKMKKGDDETASPFKLTPAQKAKIEEALQSERN